MKQIKLFCFTTLTWYFPLPAALSRGAFFRLSTDPNKA
jgi:hypothetical protein